MADTTTAGDVVPAQTREELLVQHAEARRQRNSAPLGSHEWEAASGEVGRIEIEIARLRAGDGPAAGLGAAERSPETETHPLPFSALTAMAQAGSNGGPAIVRPMDGVVLVLNQNYEPLNVCNIPRAFRLVFGAKAEVIEYDHATIRTVRAAYRAPSRDPPPAPGPPAAAAREADPARDLRARPPHLPVLRPDRRRPDPGPRRPAPPGRRHTWENLVAACKPCNHRKGGRRPRRPGSGSPAPRSSRAATCTRCSRRTSRTTATRPGATTSSSAGTERLAAPRAAERGSRGPSPPAVVEVLDHLHALGPRRVRRGWLAARCAAGPRPARLGPRHRRTPERIVELFPGAVYENRFGTVAVRRDTDVFEITTFRTDHDYADFRRPHRVEFGTDVIDDLARRDFTVNAIAWGAGRRVDRRSGLVDPIRRRGGPGAGALLRAVGDPAARFDEDALRMIRAVRLAADARLRRSSRRRWRRSGATRLVRYLSGERIGAELRRSCSQRRGPRSGSGLAEYRACWP